MKSCFAPVTVIRVESPRVCLLSACQQKYQSRHCRASQEREPSGFLCLSKSFYRCQDLGSVVSGELVCRVLGEYKHEKPLFTVWLQHTNIREASLM